jgi:hypothetical protein
MGPGRVAERRDARARLHALPLDACSSRQLLASLVAASVAEQKSASHGRFFCDSAVGAVSRALGRTSASGAKARAARVLQVRAGRPRERLRASRELPASAGS